VADPADERAAYREALARAEAAAVVTDEAGRETPAAPNELPGAVPVAASDQPLPVEPAVADTPTEQPATPALPQEPAAVVEETPEQLREKLAAAEARLAEKDTFIGRQSSEVGELRTAVDEMRQQLATAVAQPVAPVAPPIVITQELIDEQPALAVQAAFAQQNEPVLQVAFEAWKEEDPFAASQWLFNQQAAQREAAWKAEQDALRAEIAQVKEPLAQRSAQDADRDVWTESFGELQKTYPDFLQNAEKLLTEYAPQFPAIASLIADGDKDAKVQGLTLLYEKSRLGNPDAVRAELEQAATAAAAESAASLAGAAVVSGQTTAGQGSIVEKTAEELEAERYLQRQSGRASLDKGWTGR